MERISVEELVSLVRTAIDENRTEHEYLVTETDNMELDEIIRSNILHSVRFILESCPVSMLLPIALDVKEVSQSKNDDGSGCVLIPDDFLRLVSFKLSSWNRAVVNVADEGSGIELMQRNGYTRGTPIKPVCVYSHDDIGNRIIEYFTAGKEVDGMYNHDVQHFLYVMVPSIEEDEEGNDTVILPHLLKFAVIYYCAGLTETNRGNVQFADSFFKMANSSIIQTNQ